MIRIRRATIKDLNILQKMAYQLAEVERKGWDPTLDSIWILSSTGRKTYRIALEHSYVLFAEDNGKVIGYLIGSIHQPEKNAIRATTLAQITNIFVMEPYQHQGIGTALLRTFKGYCRKQKVHDLDVLVLAKNKKAQKFYAHMNFIPKRITMTQKIKP